MGERVSSIGPIEEKKYRVTEIFLTVPPPLDLRKIPRYMGENWHDKITTHTYNYFPKSPCGRGGGGG